ncbi:MAG: hypothetical protein IPH00_16105 [Flavobacteriales bacterium]|nr:hypothetical protein [Flavobacteriales bacterium]
MLFWKQEFCFKRIAKLQENKMAARLRPVTVPGLPKGDHRTKFTFFTFYEFDTVLAPVIACDACHQGDFAKDAFYVMMRGAMVDTRPKVTSGITCGERHLPVTP